MPHDVQIRPPLQQRVDPALHPSNRGRTNGYSQDMRQLAMEIRAQGHSNNPLITVMRAQHNYPSLLTENRWQELLNTLGHYRQCRHTGNNRATVLRDHDQILHVLYRLAYPKATQAEINAFLYRANFGNVMFRFYCASQITECENRVGLTRKRGSTTAYQALLPRNVFWRWRYWNMAYPLGIADIRQQDLIDLDECGIEMSTADRKIGKAYIGKRVSQTGLYSKSEKWNLLLAISGDPNGNRWYEMWTGEGTTGERMIDFIRTIINEIGNGTPARRRCFIMDNLR